MKLYNSTAIHNTVDFPELIAFMKKSLREKAIEVELPARTLIFKKEPFSVFGSMPVLDNESNLFVVKNAAFVSGNNNNIGALTTVFNSLTGNPIALIEGATMTGYRTAAASGAITSHCATKDASVLSIIGAGVQAWYHALSMLAIRPIKEIRVFSRSTKKLHKFVSKLKEQKSNLSVIISESIDDCVENADIVITATSSNTPLVSASKIKETAHVCVIGGHTKMSREISHKDMFQHLVVSEDIISAISEAGEEHKNAIEPNELFSIDKDKLSSQKTFFSSIGTAVLDLYFVKYLLAKNSDESESFNL